MNGISFDSNSSKRTLIIALIVIVVAALIGWFIWSNNRQKAYLESATNKYQQGDIAGASEDYKALLDKFGGSAEIWSNYGNALRDLKKYDEAFAAYQQAIKMDRAYNTAYRNLSYLAVDMEEVNNQVGKIDEAIAIIEKGFQDTGSDSVYLAEDLIMLYGKKGNEAKVNEYKAIREKLLAEQ